MNMDMLPPSARRALSDEQLAAFRRSPVVFMASLAADHGAPWLEALDYARSLVIEVGVRQVAGQADVLCSRMRSWAMQRRAELA